MKTNIDRREFLKTAGMAAAVTAGAGMFAGCKGKPSSAAAVTAAEGEMEFRANPNSNDKVSILGYGCMRWPMIKDAEGKDIVDQEAVNHLVDHAIKHGVNYFDTAPVYLQGQSETATGIALKRHPRQKYFIATKLSNMRDHTFEGAVSMYKRSMQNLQTEYIDYYLLHSVADGEIFRKRFIDSLELADTWLACC